MDTTSIQFLTSSEAVPYRKARMIAAKASHVIHLEFSDGVFQELDADDYDHAFRLADTWLNTFNAISVNILPVKDGKLDRKNGKMVDFRDFMKDD